MKKILTHTLPYAGFAFVVATACGNANDASTNAASASQELRSNPIADETDTTADEQIPFTLGNPEANLGYDSHGNYIGWVDAVMKAGFIDLNFAYDATLNSNVFDIITYRDPGNDNDDGFFSMEEAIPSYDWSQAVKDAVAAGYPVQCEAQTRVSYKKTYSSGNLNMIMRTRDKNGRVIDSCERRVTAKDVWQKTTCGPLASVSMYSLSISFECAWSYHCKIDKVKCYVVKKAGFERFQPQGQLNNLQTSY
ncbi:MAG: hypothetical protein HYY84_04815 [Deltaproteobacteria bacterium]|nr:hypothetical protein [Deltaproteobacteria bacterium]